MSEAQAIEAPEAEDFDAEFEAAREADHDLDEQEAAEGEEEAEEAPPAPDLAKIAEDKDRALRAERAKRREASRRAQELEARLSQLESQRQAADPIAELVQSLQDGDDDPIGDINQLKQVIKNYFSQQQQDVQTQQQQLQEQRAIETLSLQIKEFEDDFKSDHADYDDAVQFYRKTLVEDLQDAGYEGRDLEQEFARQLISFSRRAIQSGKDPAEAVYNAAKRRGFAVDNATKKLQTISKAAKVGATPSASKSAPARLTPAYVATLKGAAFDKAYETLKRQEKGR